MGLAAKLPKAGYNTALPFRSVSSAGCEIPSEEGQGKDMERDGGGQEHWESGPEQTLICFSVLEASKETSCCFFPREVVEKPPLNFLNVKNPERGAEGWHGQACFLTSF